MVEASSLEKEWKRELVARTPAYSPAPRQQHALFACPPVRPRFQFLHCHSVWPPRHFAGEPQSWSSYSRSDDRGHHRQLKNYDPD